MRKCAQCSSIIVKHVWVVENRDFCGKSCYCDFLGHRHPLQKRFCDRCRGPQLPPQEKRPQAEVIRSRKKVGKLMKRGKPL